MHLPPGTDLTPLLADLCGCLGLLGLLVFGYGRLRLYLAWRETTAGNRDEQRSWTALLGLALLFGLIATLAGLAPLQPAPGLALDMRLAVLALAGLYTPLPAAAGAALATTGLGAIGLGAGPALQALGSVLLGWGWRWPRSPGTRSRSRLFSALAIVALGLVLSCLALTAQPQPQPLSASTRWQSLAGLLFFFPVALVLGAALLETVERLLRREQQLRHASERQAQARRFDPLTGLPNRRHFVRLLSDALMQATQRGDALVAVACLNLDGYRRINEQLGRAAGDAALGTWARDLRLNLRGGDLLGRLDGDQFAIALVGCRDHEQARQRLEALRATAAGLKEFAGAPPVQPSASAGLTFHPDDRAPADVLLRHAELALYAAKEQGRNTTRVFDAGRDSRLQARREAVAQVLQALHEGHMELHYQPKVRVSSGQVVGAEALVRWRHPQRGLLAPGSFLPQILGTPAARALDDWVLDAAIAQAAAWAARGLALPVSINMSVPSLVAAEFLPRLSRLLAARPALPAGAVEIELLETETMSDLSQVRRAIEALAELGVSVSIDDFGTGYSTLSYLQQLPAQSLKIDQSFVRDLLERPMDRALVRGIIGLARAFERDVVAEGVESAGHARALVAMGCDILQGYGIARPMPAEALPPWIAAWRTPADFLPSGREGDADVAL
ncbi:EAL domain-containing protein [Pelomonas sp. CA6]|uniref:putative bifunctional diguanylate cyclase/phosphodiesterase n=1 Tax=Pelomonas sp. CA6 TaxID=2907999 RepID=UPI001F4BCF05|nr:GGDEF domain-containing phosphodiesterase [Pelomonas sp. CA6]MCH7345545.1 EAL domain-containing protein [Pelomonas sp. CA6]